jgi:hypothetical protein
MKFQRYAKSLQFRISLQIVVQEAFNLAANSSIKHDTEVLPLSNSKDLEPQWTDVYWQKLFSAILKLTKFTI